MRERGLALKTRPSLGEREGDDLDTSRSLVGSWRRFSSAGFYVVFLPYDGDMRGTIMMEFSGRTMYDRRGGSQLRIAIPSSHNG